MLQTLSIRNVLLIDRLDLTFEPGMGILTGETGAGKSILLDAMGLALGERASPRLVRTGETQATVIAEFELPVHSPLGQMLEELDLSIEEPRLLLRRTLNADGKSRAFVNDQQVSLALLKTLGEALVEIHGQFDQMLDPLTHRRYLDDFGGLTSDLEKVRIAFADLENIRRIAQQTRQNLADREVREAFLKQALHELEQADLKPDEEEHLLQERDYLQHQTKIVEAAQTARETLEGEKGVESRLASAHRTLEKVSETAGNIYGDALAALSHASVEVQETLSILSGILQRSGRESQTLAMIDDRLHMLRGLSRKHRCSIDDLVSIGKKFHHEQEVLAQSDNDVANLDQQLEKARSAYRQEAQSLSAKRQCVARTLEESLQKEFAPLKLEKASLKVNFVKLSEEHWSAEGIDQIEFQVQTNPGMPFGSFAKIASGGERARIMLALKVILAQESRVSLLIFDEIDAGAGGAVASAIGERLSRLGKRLQLLTITHSPQVSAYADFHWHVFKRSQNQKTTTHVVYLADAEREEEIARMLAGESITEEARAAAHALKVAADAFSGKKKSD